MRVLIFRTVILVFLSTSAFLSSATAQQPPTLAKGQHVLTVKSGATTTIDLRAKEASLKEIAEDLSKRLSAKVVLSALMETQLVSIDLKSSALEPAMQALAPQVFIDYKLNSGKQFPATIYLSAYNEPAPSFEAIQPGSQAILFEGDTEEGTENQSEEVRKRIENQPLRVIYDTKTLTVRSKAQPLTFVALRVGQELSIPVELKTESNEPVTVDIVEAPVEEAVTRISPLISLYVRADLQSSTRKLVRMVVAASPSQAQTSSNKQ